MGLFPADVTRESLLNHIRELNGVEPVVSEFNLRQQGMTVNLGFVKLMDLCERSEEYSHAAKLQDCKLEKGVFHLDYGRAELVLPFSNKMDSIWYVNKQTGMTLKFNVNELNLKKFRVDLSKTTNGSRNNPHSNLIYDAGFVLYNALHEIRGLMQDLRRRGCTLAECEQQGTEISKIVMNYSLERSLYLATLPAKK